MVICLHIFHSFFLFSSSNEHRLARKENLYISTPQAGNSKSHLTISTSSFPVNHQPRLPQSPSFVPTVPSSVYISVLHYFSGNSILIICLVLSFLFLLLLFFLPLTQSNCFISTHTNGTHSASLLPRMLDLKEWLTLYLIVTVLSQWVSSLRVTIFTDNILLTEEY